MMNHPMGLFLGLGIIGLILVFLVAWFVAAFPLYIAGRMISGRNATFGEALVAAAIGPLVTIFFFIVVSALLFPFMLGFAYIIGFIVAIGALSYIFGALFRTSTLGGFGIALISFIFTVIIFAVVSLFAILLTGQPVVGVHKMPVGIFP